MRRFLIVGTLAAVAACISRAFYDADLNAGTTFFAFLAVILTIAALPWEKF